ncbi:hypothetical protein [Bradyrhizobium sp. ARR65]|uniref:hypothetical protein n=1 Tax=Bradyrhizobium sp. ARR65 TaxID=1040989 RepID=UPI001FD89079|nr:hypothetical protein [Bradyrhizobium sp. ARR65]
MRRGDFERAWEMTDRDLAALCPSGRGKHEGPRHEQRIWRGEDLYGKRVLVRCYHGLGDTIQFIRFARPLREIAREVIVWCQPELVTLVSRVDGVDRILPLHDGAADVDFDVDIEIMEIPHAIRAKREQVRLRGPYLTLSRPVRRIHKRADDLAIGLLWSVGDWDKRRALPSAELRRLDIPGVRLFSLQRGAAAKAANEIGAIDISTPDLETLARRLLALDLVICPDTMIAHLSAALGCETWILLHCDCDWRWPSSGSTSFWYPSARLFHQATAGDWRTVIDEVRCAIISRLQERRRGLPCGINVGRTPLPPPERPA